MNEESIGLSFLVSLTGESRMAAAGFVQVGRVGKIVKEHACLRLVFQLFGMSMQVLYEMAGL